MSIEENKAIVKELFSKFQSDTLDQALELLAADAHWTVMGDTRRFPYAGRKDKQGAAQQLRAFLGMMATFRWVPNVITAEDDRVVVEAESHGTSADGKKYHNFYHVIFIIRDGKIHTVREYLDPLEVFEFTGEMSFP